MATYPPILVNRTEKTALPVPTGDAYVVGDKEWYISDNNTNTESNKGIPVPAGVPYLVRATLAKFAHGNGQIVELRMASV